MNDEHPLRTALRLRGIQQVELARFADVTHPYVSNVLALREPGSPRFRDAAARLTGFEERALFKPNDDQTADVSTRTSNGRRSKDARAARR